MDHHLAGEEPGNRRNGYGRKTVLTDTGKIALAVPRDRQSSFDPQLIAKYQRRFPGFDDKIISMYARGMSTREIVGHLRDLYGIEVSPDLISAVTEAVLDEVAAWQARPLEATYPLIFFDALRVKIRDEELVRNKAVHIALGVRADGAKEILGLWLEQNEGAKFWLRVMNELKNRGVEDVLIAIVDGSKSFPEAIIAVFPQATVQTCTFICCATASILFLGRTVSRRSGPQGHLPAVDAVAGETALTAFEEATVPQIPGNPPELAARLRRSRPVLCLPHRRSAHFVHHQCHRGAHFQAPPAVLAEAISPAMRRDKAPLPVLPFQKSIIPRSSMPSRSSLFCSQPTHHLSLPPSTFLIPMAARACSPPCQPPIRLFRCSAAGRTRSAMSWPRCGLPTSRRSRPICTPS